MRAVQVVAPGRAEFVTMSKPEPQPGHALIRVRRVSLCGSDIAMLHYAPPEHYPFPPGTSGHEVVGEIVAINPGDASLIDVRGLPINIGDNALVLVKGHLGMAEYCTVPINMVFPLSPDKPIEHQLQAQQMGTVIYASRFLPNLVGKDVAVIGQGSAGLWFNFMARRMGARRVFGVDLQAHRLAIAPHYGATDLIHNAEGDALEMLAAATNGELADVVIEAAGEDETVNLAYHLVKEHGDVLYFGVPRTTTVTLDYRTFYYKYPRVKTICDAQREPGQRSTMLALELITTGEIDVGPVLTHSLPFEQTLDAYELQNTRDEGAIKIVIEVSE